MSSAASNLNENAAVDALAVRFADSISCEPNKPDYRELDLDSPVSHLMISNAGGGVPTSSSSGSSSGSATGKASLQGRSGAALRSQLSGDISDMSEIQSPSRPGHRRSVSAGAPWIYSSSKHPDKSNLASKVNPSIYLSGNICPSGKISKPTTLQSSSGSRPRTLGSGTGNYGHGSVIRRAAEKANGPFMEESMMYKQGMESCDPEEVKQASNHLYRRGSFHEALAVYDRAISLFPENASFRSNRSAALMALGRLREAAMECGEALRLNPSYGRTRQRLFSLYLRLGQVEDARLHANCLGQHVDPMELQKLQLTEKLLKSCIEARKIGDWKTAVREVDAALAAGADSSRQLVACKAEGLLKLHRIHDADTALSSIMKVEHGWPLCSQFKFSGMLAEAYVHYVQSQVDMALGRFENAISAAEKARMIDKTSVDIAILLNNVKRVAKARARGNDLFSSSRYTEACAAYGEGLKYDKHNSVLYCNRAVCWSKLGVWEKSIEDCNKALYIQPNYTKALLRRAVSYGKLGRWAEAVKDYEILHTQLPGDDGVTESLHGARTALKAGEGFQSAKLWLK